MTKLYELPRGTYFKIDEGELLNHENQEIFYLDHIDGSYSVCRDVNMAIHHFAAWTPVIKYETLSA